MAEITELDVSVSRKVQLQQFEPVEVGAGATVTVEEGDDPDEVYDDTYEKVEGMVERNLLARIAQAKEEGEDENT